MSCPLYCDGKLSLVICAGPRNTPRQYLRPFGHTLLELGNILIIDFLVIFIGAERAYLFTGLFSSARSSLPVPVISFHYKTLLKLIQYNIPV